MPPILKKFRLAYQVVRHLGVAWILFRLRYAIAQRVGWFSWRYPAQAWEDVREDSIFKNASLADEATLAQEWERNRNRFFFVSEDFQEWRAHLESWDREVPHSLRPGEQAERVSRGEFPFFGNRWIDPGFPPDWFANPLEGGRIPPDKHWSAISEQAVGDIKNVWELSRFSWAYPLVRAYARDGDSKWAGVFWKLFEDWIRWNPPQQGPHWKCGQEVAFRGMALMVALAAFAKDPETTPGRVSVAVKVLAVFAKRVRANLAYAVSQRNNHSLSEAAFLLGMGIVWPELKGSGRWFELGKQQLSHDCKRLFYADGGFAQNSNNYHRVALHDLLWAVVLWGRNFDEAPVLWRETVARGWRFLLNQSCCDDCVLPASGPNDGALVFPLSSSLPWSYRPLIQHAAFAANGVRPFPNGLWSEELLWFHGSGSLEVPCETVSLGDFFAGVSGINVLRDDRWTVLLRAPKYWHRPLQADLLHVEVGMNGRWLTADPGTYSYEGSGHIRRAMKTSDVHNTVTVDGQSQMEPVGKFLFLPWVGGESIAPDWFELPPSSRCAAAVHDGYRRLRDPVRHERAVVLGDGEVWVLDRLSARESHHYRLHWLLRDDWEEVEGEDGVFKIRENGASPNLHLWTSANEKVISAVRGDSHSDRGWYSPTYQDLEPGTSIAMETEGKDVLFVSYFGFRPPLIRLDSNRGLRLG